MMKTRYINIPSVIERYPKPLSQIAAPLEKRLQLYEAGSGFLVGGVAFSQGQIPYRNINSSPADTDYQLLAKAGLLLASGAQSGEVVVTTGFPSAVYELFRQQAEQFFSVYYHRLQQRYVKRCRSWPCAIDRLAFGDDA